MSMKCPKCAGQRFVLETAALVVESRKIRKNGRVAVRPYYTHVNDWADVVGEQVIRCVQCETEYVLPYSREELLSMNFSKVDLSREGEEK